MDSCPVVGRIGWVTHWGLGAVQVATHIGKMADDKVPNREGALEHRIRRLLEQQQNRRWDWIAA